MNLEQIIMELVVNGGNARSHALEAISAAREKNFELAKQKMKEAKDSISKAHHFQTDMIQAEAAGEHTEVSLVLVHGQDHLMNAMTVMDLAEQMIEMYRIIYSK